MRTRPSDGYRRPASASRGNDLYRRFRSAFDALLAAENPGIARNEYRDWFVRTPELEAALRDSTTGEIDSIRFLVGNTGIGKSTTLRYVFGAANAPQIENDALVIPFCFNNRAPVTDAFNPVISAASTRVINEYQLSFSLDEFFDFVSVTRPDLLEQDAALSEAASRHDRVEALKRLHRLGFELEKLKFLLTKTQLSRAILIVDDIESLPFDPQANFIADICKAHGFLQNQPRRQFSVKSIIACRPTTQSLLRTQKWYSAYSFDEPIYITNVVELDKLFEARFQAALKNTNAGKDITNRADWDRAYEILLRILKQLSTIYQIELTSLCNNNVRDALHELQHLLTNRRWFQRDKIANPAFTIKESEYAINEAAVYRAMALREGNVYPGDHTVIKNLLQNTADPASDLLVTYVVRYLLNQKSAGEEVGRSQVPLALLERELSMFFTELAGTATLAWCIDYMLRARLIESELVNEATIIALTPRAEILWRILQSNSICLEFFRDDTFQEGDDLAPLTPTEHHYADETFLAVIGFLDRIVAAEEKRVVSCKVNNLVTFYLGRFGQQTLSRHLLHGIGYSIGRFYVKAAPSAVVKDAFAASKERITKLETLLSEAS